MKLREFVANSLPRVRGKKKKQTSPAPRTLNNERYDANRNHYKSAESNQDWERRHTNNNKCPAPEAASDYSINQAVKSVCGEIIDTFNIDAYNFRVNNSLGEDQYTCYNDLSPYQKTDDLDKKNEPANVSASDSEKQCNTAPKTRSRIRTNPWLPSPRSTPSNTSSGSSSPSSSIATFPITPPSGKLRSLCIRDVCSLSTTSSDSFMDTDHSASSPDTAEADASVGTLYRDKWCGRLDLSHLCKFSEEGQYSYTAWDTDASTDLSPCTDNCQCNENVAEPEHNISFEYEEALDDTLEKDSVKRDISLQDLLDEESPKDVAVQTEFEDYEDDSDWLVEASSDEGSTDLTSGECIKLCCVNDIMQDSTDTGYSSLGRDGHTEVDEEFQFIKPDQYDQTSCVVEVQTGQEMTICESASPQKECPHEIGVAARFSPDSELDFGRSRFVSSRYPEETSGRTLQEIRTSLEEKVFLLRQEKRIVEQKIKEAQEEERIRKQEKMRFHRQLSVHRKQILLKTLHDLKAKLESQSDRLQDSYSAVLTMQQRFAQRTSPLLLLASTTT